MLLLCLLKNKSIVLGSEADLPNWQLSNRRNKDCRPITTNSLPFILSKGSITESLLLAESHIQSNERLEHSLMIENKKFSRAFID